jgi:phosphate uptake regulator
MKRRVIQIANSTQLISLPRKWSQKYNIQKGDELEVEEEGDQLLIKTEGQSSVKEIMVDVSGLTPRLADRFMARAYQKGYDMITIKYNSPELSLAIQNKVKELIGFEVMDQTKNTIVVKSITQKLNIEFDPSLRRAFLILLDMADSCLEAFSEGDKKALKNLHYKDLDLNKFCYFCLRCIRKGHHGSFGHYILYYLIENMEDAGDEYKALAQHLEKIDSKKKKELIKTISKVNELAKLSYDFFYKPEKRKVIDSVTLYDEIQEMIRNALSTKDVNEASALNSLSIISRIMYHYPTMRLDTLEDLGN